MTVEQNDSSNLKRKSQLENYFLQNVSENLPLNKNEGKVIKNMETDKFFQNSPKKQKQEIMLETFSNSTVPHSLSSSYDGIFTKKTNQTKPSKNENFFDSIFDGII